MFLKAIGKVAHIRITALPRNIPDFFISLFQKLYGILHSHSLYIVCKSKPRHFLKFPTEISLIVAKPHTNFTGGNFLCKMSIYIFYDWFESPVYFSHCFYRSDTVPVQQTHDLVDTYPFCILVRLGRSP